MRIKPFALAHGVENAEIAGVAWQNRACAVALSLGYPDDDPQFESELTRSRKVLSPDVTLLVGGRAMSAHRETLDKIGALPTKNLAPLCTALDELRKPARKRVR